MFKDFKEFIMRGNVLDLAIGIIIGGAFGKIVSSFVADIVMPPVGLILGKVDFSSLYLNLSDTPYTSLAEAKKAGAPTVNYGIFVNSLVDFLIVAFCVFLLVKLANAAKRPQVATDAVPAMQTCPQCLTSIPVGAKRCAHCTSQLA